MYSWYTPLNASLTIVPPLRRIEEMAALIEAGVLDVLGPRLEVRAEGGAWLAHSPDVPGSTVRAITLVEALVGESDPDEIVDPEYVARTAGAVELLLHTVVPGRGALAEDAHPDGVAVRRVPGDRPSGTERLVVRVCRHDKDSHTSPPLVESSATAHRAHSRRTSPNVRSRTAALGGGGRRGPVKR